MKQSISRKISRRVTIVLFVAMLIFEIGSYLFLSRIILDEYNLVYRTIAYMYGDLITYECTNEHKTFEDDISDIAIKFGDYFIEYYKCDTCYIYVPYSNNTTFEEGNYMRKYICYCDESNYQSDQYPDHLVGVEVPYNPSYDEDMVLGGYSDIYQYKNGDKIVTIILLTDGITRYLIGIEYPYNILIGKIINCFIIFSIVVFIGLVLVYLLFRIIINKKVKEPVLNIYNNMKEFISNGHRQESKLEIKGNDELAMIASEYNELTDSIEEYIKSINTLASEKSKQKAELDVAYRIQQGYLQHEPLRTDEFIASGIMKPAKSVGGDLFDYFLINENKVLLTVADVSDKGIIAAMYMVITLTLIRQYARLGLLPNEILEHTNNTLCEKNALSLFSTVFIAIYDKRDKTLTYSNGGHNYPYIIGDELIILDQAKGSLVGLFDNEVYENCTIKLKDNDILFMYTDGVTEATDKENNFFTEQRLERLLNDFKNNPSRNLIKFIDDEINKFVKDADQHDDITMLTFSLVKHDELVLDFNILEFEKVKNYIFSLGLPKEKAMKLCLVIEEFFANICSYAFPDGVDSNEKIIVDFEVSNKIVITITDGGMEFNPLNDLLKVEDYDMENSIGGLGKFIASSIADDISYKYENKKNILTITIL